MDTFGAASQQTYGQSMHRLKDQEFRNCVPGKIPLRRSNIEDCGDAKATARPHCGSLANFIATSNAFSMDPKND